MRIARWREACLIIKCTVINSLRLNINWYLSWNRLKINSTLNAVRDFKNWFSNFYSKKRFHMACHENGFVHRIFYIPFPFDISIKMGVFLVKDLLTKWREWDGMNEGKKMFLETIVFEKSFFKVFFLGFKDFLLEHEKYVWVEF